MAIISEQISGTSINIIIKSSNLKFATYYTDSSTLQVTFKNDTIYEYYEVPWDIFTKLRMSDSQGKYFNANISRNYKFKKK